MHHLVDVAVYVSTHSYCQYLCLLATTVMFGQSKYSVNEYEELSQAVLALSNPSSTDLTVQVTNTDGSATGMRACIIVV